MIERLTEALGQIADYKNAALALGATHFLDKARDYGRLPQVLHKICEACHSKH